MKRVFLPAILFSVILAGCQNSNQGPALRGPVGGGLSQNKALKDSANFTTIQWLDSTYRDLGKVTDGDQVEVTYRFRNTGNKPLIIAQVSASCGCTIPETPQEPFAPGAEGLIKARFNSSGRVGTNNKEIYVMANTTPSTLNQLEFTIQVQAKDR
ncbi:MAG TPA: DUF1573 domain-containing protein [Chitinophagaceae bacterium]|nr:DUF1573 domain-containing protein [Chitinophagaceae bacterium]